MGAARQALRAARSSVSSDDRPALGSRSRPFSSGPSALTVGSCPPGQTGRVPAVPPPVGHTPLGPRVQGDSPAPDSGRCAALHPDSCRRRRLFLA